MMEKTLINNNYNSEEFNMFTYNESLVLTITLFTFKHKLNTHLFTIFTNIYRYYMENSSNNLKKIFINYIKIRQLQIIIKSINVYKTFKESVLCSNGIIYY